VCPCRRNLNINYANGTVAPSLLRLFTFDRQKHFGLPRNTPSAAPWLSKRRTAWNGLRRVNHTRQVNWMALEQLIYGDYL
jgi:hypothetical protein